MSIYYIWFNGSIVFKLIPMALIILFATTHLIGQATIKQHHIITLIGLLFCISGDYLIAKSFIIGLFTFLFGHICYIISFKKQMIAEYDKWVLMFPFFLLIGMTILTISLTIKENYALITPILLYTSIIVVMCYTAWRTKNIGLIVGSFLFLISDFSLAWNKFVSTIPYSGVLIMVTYYSANYLIANSLMNKIDAKNNR